MSFDRRELISQRVFAILQTVPNIESYVRNRAEMPDDKRPCIIYLDADERTILKPIPQNNSNLSTQPEALEFNPEIYVSLEARKPNNENVGQDLNAYRMVILKKLFEDTALKELLGPNGKIQYKGCVTDLARGRPMNGELGLDIAFVYFLKPSEL